MNRRQVLKGLVSAVAWLPLLATKKPTVSSVKVHNPIQADDLPRKVVHFPNLDRNGGQVGHESFVTEWHVHGPYFKIANVDFINTEIHVYHSERGSIKNSKFTNYHKGNIIHVT